MAINRVESESAAWPERRKAIRGAAEGSAQGVSFAEALRAVVEDGSRQVVGSIPAATAAEMLRLKMMKNAISLTDTPGMSQSFCNTPVELLLASLANVEAAVSKPAGVVPLKDIGSEGGELSLKPIILKAANRYGVDQRLINAVIKAESNFNHRAVSQAGAQGLMQLMPATARGLGVTDPFDPEQNIMAGTRFLKDLLVKYGGNLDATLAAYNFGPGNVDKGRVLPRETREYLVRVKSYYHHLDA